MNPDRPGRELMDSYGGLKSLTSLAVYLLGSSVEIHLAGGGCGFGESVMLGRGGRSGDMLTAHSLTGSQKRCSGPGLRSPNLLRLLGNHNFSLEPPEVTVDVGFHPSPNKTEEENVVLPVSCFRIKAHQEVLNCFDISIKKFIKNKQCDFFKS